MDSDAGVTVVALLEAIDIASVADLLDSVDAALGVAWLGSNEGTASVVCNKEDTSSILDGVATVLGVSDSVREAAVKPFRSDDVENNTDADSVEPIDSVDVGKNPIELVELFSSLVEGAETTKVVKRVGGDGSVSVSIDVLTSVEDVCDEIDGVT